MKGLVIKAQSGFFTVQPDDGGEPIISRIRGRLKQARQESTIVAVGDRDALQNPVTFLRCVPGATSGAQSSAVLEPCAASYTLSKDDNEFYVLYAGLTPDMCHTFCTNLEGCTAH